MHISSLIKRFLYGKHTPAVVVEISRGSLLHNIRTYQDAYPDFMFAPVLKSNAYGHGLMHVAQILNEESVPFLVLDSLYEARQLRTHGIRTSILIIGYTSAENICAQKLQHVAFTLTSIEQLRTLRNECTKKVFVHLKVDTGMHRQGILPDEISEALSLIGENKHIQLQGLCSHFADADSEHASFTEKQIHTWNTVVEKATEAYPNIPYIHISATAGTAYATRAKGNLVRLGLGLYGINPSPFLDLPLKPALKMTTVIGTVKLITKGEHVGYNGTYCAERDVSIATVPVGYFEGVDRRLSNCGSFKIGETFCPVIGRVSMNITSIDVTNVPTVSIGDEVTVISNETNDENSVVNLAKKAQTIPWEILIHIPQHLKRIIITDW